MIVDLAINRRVTFDAAWDSEQGLAIHTTLMVCASTVTSVAAKFSSLCFSQFLPRTVLDSRLGRSLGLFDVQLRISLEAMSRKHGRKWKGHHQLLDPDGSVTQHEMGPMDVEKDSVFVSECRLFTPVYI
jgi:hypothetical protein